MFQYINIQVVPGGELVVTCSRYEVVLLRHIRRQVGRPGGGQVQGEYIQVVERVPVEYQGVVTCVDSDGSTLIIGDSLVFTTHHHENTILHFAGTSNALLVWDIESKGFIRKIGSGNENV